MRWIGGAPAAGKSTVARRLAAVHGLRLHELEPFSRYVSRTTSASAPMLHAFMAMDMDERWLQRSPAAMYETFHAFHGEWFDLVVDDVLALPRDRPVLVEGFALLPRLVVPLLTRPTQAVWLLPSAEFRRQALARRGSTWTIPATTSDPERARANLETRDRLFTEALRAEAAALGAHTIEVDAGSGEDALAARVAAALALAGP